MPQNCLTTARMEGRRLHSRPGCISILNLPGCNTYVTKQTGRAHYEMNKTRVPFAEANSSPLIRQSASYERFTFSDLEQVRI